MEKIVDLDNYRSKKNVKVLSGRDTGEKYRKSLKLEQLEKEYDVIKVLVPDDIFSFNSSYFLGMFGPSVRKLGEEKFREKYVFECDEVIEKNIEDGIASALKDSDVLRD